MKRVAIGLLVLVMYLLHQDVWLWQSARPLLLGFVPAGLAYHAAHTIASCLLLWALVKLEWPRGLGAAAGAPRGREEPGS